MNDLGFGVRDRIEKAIYNKRKHISFRFESSVNSKAPTVIQKANRALFKELSAVRDKNAVIVSMKSSLDGIADAIGVNDASFHFKELQISDTRKPPEIEVWLSWKELSGE